MRTRTSHKRPAREEPGITRTPGIRGGSPCIAGTGIRVADIVRHRYELGETPQDTAKALPHLSVEQVETALRFYEKNKAEIDAYIAHEDKLFRDHVNPPVPGREHTPDSR